MTGSLSPRGSRTYTELSDLGPPGGPTVVATRSLPWYSDIEYWLSSRPGTVPDPTWRGLPAPVVSNLYSSVVGGCVGRGPSTVGMAAPRSLATYRLLCVPYTMSPSATIDTGSPVPRFGAVRSKLSTVSMEAAEYVGGWASAEQPTWPSLMPCSVRVR